MELITLYQLKAERRAAVTQREAERQSRLEQERMKREEKGALLRSWRLELGVTQENMAVELGVSRGRISRLELGRRVNDPRLLRNAYEIHLQLESTHRSYLRLEEENTQLRKAQSEITVRFAGRQWCIKVPEQRRVI